MMGNRDLRYKQAELPATAILNKSYVESGEIYKWVKME
jgi:hypothetical protein